MGADCGGVGGANYGPMMYPCNSTGAILVLFILLVIILKSCWL